MDKWAQRGHIFLTVIFVFMAFTYLAERIVYHSVIGFGSGLTSPIITVVLVGMGFFIWQGYGWIRWPLGAFFLLNGLGTPRGMADVFGPTLAVVLSLLLLVAHVGSAIALCLTPGIPAFLRYQRARRKARKSDPVSTSNSG